MLDTLNNWSSQWSFYAMENPHMAALWSIVLAFVVALVFSVFLFFHRPVWLGDDEIETIGIVRKFWGRFRLVAVVLGFVAPLVSVGVAYHYERFGEMLFLASLSTIVVVPAAMSVLTDLYMRLVDRWLLRLAMVLSGVFGAALMVFRFASSWSLVTFGLVLVLILSTFLFPRFMGASDARALFVVVSAVFPALLTGGFALSMGLSVLLSFVFSSWVSDWDFKVSLRRKASIPLVPMLLIPAVFLVVFTPVFWS